MNALTDQIAVVVARHSPITGLGYSRTRCGCGEVFTAPFVKSHAAHVAEQIAAELRLTESTQRLRQAAESEASKSWRDLLSLSADEAHGRNQAGEHMLCEIARLPWVSAWSAVEGKP